MVDVLLRKLAKGEADPVPDELVREAATHPAEEEAPARVLQHALVPVKDQMANVRLVLLRRLALAEGHVTNPSCHLNQVLGVGRLLIGVPAEILLVQER